MPQIKALDRSPSSFLKARHFFQPSYLEPSNRYCLGRHSPTTGLIKNHLNYQHTVNMASSPKLISVFRVIPKELFHVNNGCRVVLREWTPKQTYTFDIFTENGKVKPKALDPETYKGKPVDRLCYSQNNINRSKWHFDASKH